MANTLLVHKDVKEKMTATQRERYNMLYQFFGEESAELVRHLKRTGQNSFASVYEKAAKINKAKPSVKDYYAQLSDEFASLGKVTEDKIIRVVTEARAAHDLQPFLKRIKAQCMQEFSNLFIFVEAPDDDESEVADEDFGKEYVIHYRLLATN